jgi:hypothetical protein
LDELTFEDVQVVFLEWMNCLSWVVKTRESTLLND